MIAMLSTVNEHSGPEMHPSEEPGGCQAINPHPHFWIHQKKGEKYQKPDGGE